MAVDLEIFLCRTDNYGYLVHDVESRKTAAIDAPDAGAIIAALDRRGWTLTDILVTHHHRDHVEGIPALKARYGASVTGPGLEAEKIPSLDVPVVPGESVALGQTRFDVIGTPGHTLGHIAFSDRNGRHLFTGDALFSMGCGRMFEGRPEPTWEGLKRLRELPDDTLVYCGHEYTAENARFALSIDPRNPALNIRAREVLRMRQEDRFTIPVTLGMEKATNPFLRVDHPGMAGLLGLGPDTPPADVFATLRRAKDNFG